MGIGDIIKKRRIELGYSVDDLAEKLGKNRATIYRYESNEIENLPLSVLEPLVKILKTTPSYLMGWTDEVNEADQDAIPDFPNIHPVSTLSLPILGSVSCGIPKFAEEEHVAYIQAGTDIRSDFCLIADGESMIGARINDGDIVYVKKQATVENGEIAVVCIDDKATLKRVYYYPDKNLLLLKAANPNYKDLIYMNEELEKVIILGKAVSFCSEIPNE